jgi:CRP/FNR family transcriptional regulator
MSALPKARESKGDAQEWTELAGALGSEGIDRLRPSMRLRSVRAGEFLYLEEQPANLLWMVRSGEIRTLRTSPSGRITTLEVLRSGELFGMAAIVEGSLYPDSAQVIVSGEVWSVRQKVIVAVARERPEFGRSLLVLVARRLQSAHDRLCSFVNDSVTVRLAQTLLEEEQGDRVELTRRILGEYVGTTVETTIRILRGFERKGWIEGGIGWIRILDRAALETAARDEKPVSRAIRAREGSTS